MKGKVKRLLQKLNEEGIKRNEIAVIKTGLSKALEYILQEDYKSKNQ